MSIVLVCLPNAPKVSDEAVKRDVELDKSLESRVEGERDLFLWTFCSRSEACGKMMPAVTSVCPENQLLPCGDFCQSKLF